MSKDEDAFEINVDDIIGPAFSEEEYEKRKETKTETVLRTDIAGTTPLDPEKFTGFSTGTQKGEMLIIQGSRKGDPSLMRDSVPYLFESPEEANDWLEENAAEYNHLANNMETFGFNNLIVTTIETTIH